MKTEELMHSNGTTAYETFSVIVPSAISDAITVPSAIESAFTLLSAIVVYLFRFSN